MFGINNSFTSLGEGTVFELVPPAVPGGQWTESQLASFNYQDQFGDYPSGLAVARDGTVYVTNDAQLIKLTPPAMGHSAWSKSVLYNFGNPRDDPTQMTHTGGRIYLDGSGVVFGTVGFTDIGCCVSEGAIYRLAPSKFGVGQYRIKRLYALPHTSYDVLVGLTLGADGAFYGANSTIWRLKPPAPDPAGSWTFETLITHSSFLASGIAQPPVAHRNLNLFGAAMYGGRSSSHAGYPKNGFIYEASPPAAGQTALTMSRLYLFNDGLDGVWPNGVIDGTDGRLYGTAASGTTQPICPDPGATIEPASRNCGVVFSLVPRGGKLPWKEVVLHRFGGQPDGATPSGNLVRGTTEDGRLALFGATLSGGAYGLGTIYEIVP